MAHIDKRDTARGRRYDVRYRTPAGDHRRKTFSTFDAARTFMNSVEVDKVEGRFVDARLGRITLGEWWDEWWPTVVDLRESTRARDVTYFERHVRPTFGRVPIARIEHHAVAEWVAGLVASGLAPATVHKCHQVMRKSLRAAVRSGRLAVNPCDDVPLPRIETEEMRFLDVHELHALADAIDKRYRAFTIVGAHTGLRLGELLALRWSRVDLMRRCLDVAEVQTEVRGHLAYGPPKTRAGRRRVPFGRVVADTLTAHADRYGHDGLVFDTEGGVATRASLFRRRVWYPATVAAGLGTFDVGDDGRRHYDGLRIHDLRHTAVSWWLASGATPREVATWAGHTSVSVVLDRYGHVMRGNESTVMDRLDAMTDDDGTLAPVVDFPGSAAG